MLVEFIFSCVKFHSNLPSNIALYIFKQETCPFIVWGSSKPLGNVFSLFKSNGLAMIQTKLASVVYT